MGKKESPRGESRGPVRRRQEKGRGWETGPSSHFHWSRPTFYILESRIMIHES
jgi:hypothetical protein